MYVVILCTREMYTMFHEIDLPQSGPIVALYRRLPSPKPSKVHPGSCFRKLETPALLKPHNHESHKKLLVAEAANAFGHVGSNSTCCWSDLSPICITTLLSSVVSCWRCCLTLPGPITCPNIGRSGYLEPFNAHNIG